MIVPAADRLKGTTEYWFSKKLEQVRRMRADGKDVINLGIGSPDLAPSQAALDAASRALFQKNNHGYASYRSIPELRRALAAWYARDYRVTLDPERQILPLLGSKEGILYLSMAFLNPGDTVLVPNPGYPAYSAVANLLGAKLVHYDLREENGWFPDLENLPPAKLMWANYPHMPTGARADAGKLRALSQFARDRKLLVCNDNPYSLVLNRTPPESLLAHGLHCAELNSLSKAFNMAGWRVGMIASEPDVIDAVLQVKSNVDSGMFLPVQWGAIEALQAPPSWHEERNAVYAERRTYVWRIFDALGFRYDPEQVGLFVWARAPESVSDVAAFCEDLLLRANVFLTPGFIFGSNGTRYARSSLCADVALLKEAARRIEALS